MPTVAVTLTSEEQAALIAQAKSQGISVDALLRNAVMQIISVNSRAELQPVTLTAEEFDKAFDEAADMIPNDVVLSDEALSREGNYTREDEWNR